MRKKMVCFKVMLFHLSGWIKEAMELLR